MFIGKINNDLMDIKIICISCGAVILVKRLKQGNNIFSCFSCSEELSIDLSNEMPLYSGCYEETNAERQYWKIM